VSEQAIRDIIHTAYIEGIHNEQDPRKVHAGFHPAFRMFMRRSNDIVHVDPETILNGVINQRKTDPSSGEPKLTCEITVLDVVGSVAVARVDLMRSGALGCTDILSLYEFEDGWRIVSKLYQPHPL